MFHLLTKLRSKLLVQLNNNTKTHENVLFIIRLQQPQSTSVNTQTGSQLSLDIKITCYVCMQMRVL